MAGLGLVLGSGASELPVGEIPAVQRHGEEGYTLPHEIDHGSNLRQLADAGCDRVVGVCSVGSLRAELEPGAFVCPDDFIALDAAPATTHAGALAHRVPGFDAELRERVVAAFSVAVAVRDGGIYWQASGPRLETPAEIRLIARDADVIGMTAATECVIAGELGLPYAALCVVDNYANGIAETELTLEQLGEGRARNRATLAAVLEAALPAL